jgi:hypothetical protein
MGNAKSFKEVGQDVFQAAVEPSTLPMTCSRRVRSSGTSQRPLLILETVVLGFDPGGSWAYANSS